MVSNVCKAGEVVCPRTPFARLFDYQIPSHSLYNFIFVLGYLRVSWGLGLLPGTLKPCCVFLLRMRPSMFHSIVIKIGKFSLNNDPSMTCSESHNQMSPAALWGPSTPGSTPGTGSAFGCWTLAPSDPSWNPDSTAHLPVTLGIHTCIL